MPYRIAQRRRRNAFYLLLAAGAAAGILALGLVVASQISDNRQGLRVALTQSAQNHQELVIACVQVQALEGVIRAALVQNLQMLGAKGSPGYAYYLAHPAELAAARVSVEREIAQFRSRSCV